MTPITPTFEGFRDFVADRVAEQGVYAQYDYGNTGRCAFALYLKSIGHAQCAVSIFRFYIPGYTMDAYIDDLQLGLADAIYNGDTSKYFTEAEDHLERVERLK